MGKIIHLNNVYYFNGIKFGIDEVHLIRTIDNPSMQQVGVDVAEFGNQRIWLWKGADYIAVGDWTQAQAEAQLIIVLQAMGSLTPVKPATTPATTPNN